MIDINELRRLADHHDGVTSSAPIKPAALLEILDRLEAAEKERDDAKAAAENIALKLDYLRSKLETAEHTQNDWLRANALGGWIDNLHIENEALHAKVEQMERQEPAGKFIQHPSNGLWEQDGYGDNPDARPLYALPGAKGE